jgi:RHS repeat-associated protein
MPHLTSMRRQPKERTPGIEPLEQRLLLAGSVKVRLDHGSLLIQGDGRGNSIEITPDQSNGGVLIEGRTQNGLPTLVNGKASLTTRGENITVLLGTGDDVVEVRDIQFRDNLLIRNKGGRDQIRVINSSIHSSSVLRTGRGEDHICFQSSTAENLKIRLGAGTDRLDLNDTQIRGVSTLNGRGGIDTLARDSSSNLNRAAVKNFERFDDARPCEGESDNQPPQLESIASVTVHEGELFSTVISATDPDGASQALRYSLNTAAVQAGMTIDPGTGAFSWTPNESQGPGTYPVTVQVTDGGNRTDSASFTITVEEVNGPPLLAAIGDKLIDEGQTLNFTAVATDADVPASPLAFSLDPGAPAGASINAATGRFTWTPTEAQGPGQYTITVRVTDNSSPPLDDFETITITVNEANQPPVLAAIGDKLVDEGQTLNFTAVATDTDTPADPLTFSLDPGAPTGASINAVTGQFSWTPTEAQGPQVHNVTIRVTDSDGLSDLETIHIGVGEVNMPPTLAAIGNRSVDEGSLFEFTATATDLDSPPNALSFALDPGAPSGATIHPVTGLFRWTPSEAQGPGQYSITVRVSDNSATPLEDFETITITVNEVNQPPILSAIGDKLIDEGQTLNFTVVASDADIPAGSLTFSLDPGAPAGAGINALTGQFSWTPTEAQGPQVYDVTIRVTDSGGLSDFETIHIGVGEVNMPPTLAAIGNRSVDEGSLLQFTATATDLDSPPNALSFNLDPGAPSGAAIHPVTGLFSWTPSEAQGPGQYTITVRVTDNSSPTLDDFETITITVNEANQPPGLAAIGDKLVDEGQTLNFTAIATDTDTPAGPLTFTLDPGAPAGASINAVTGQFSWTPTEAQGPQVHNITIRVTDSGGLSDLETIHVGVGEVNMPPTLAAIGNRSVDEGSLFEFTATAADLDSPPNALSFALDPGAPSGATIHPVTGLFRWTPSEAQGPGQYTVTVRVTDNSSPTLDDFETITITVNEVNQPPILSAIGDKLIDEGQTLNFTAVASDADIPAGSLTFSLDPGAPAGAGINALTGQFSWTPTEAQGPQVYNVTVRVTDSGGQSDFETIAITVNDVTPSCVFDAGLTGWTVLEVGGSAQSHGTVVGQNCEAIMTEGNSFVISLERTFTIPSAPSAVTFGFRDLAFDVTDLDFIKDAFEVALVDSAGHPLVQPFSSSRDSFLNTTDGQGFATAGGVVLDSGHVTLGLNDIPAGTAATLIFRLVNNDSDSGTTVTVTDFGLIPSQLGTTPTSHALGGTQLSTLAVDFSHLSVVSPGAPGFELYGRTSWQDADNVLHVDFGISNVGGYALDGPVLVGIANISDPTVRLLDATQTTPSGIPYFDITSLVNDGHLQQGDSSDLGPVRFFVPNRGRFTYNLVVFAAVNDAPTITTEPELEALVGHQYRYDVDATDPNGDSLVFSLAAGPTGMAVAADTGQITWTPTSGDRGMQTVIVQVDDGRGGTTRQTYALSAIEPPPNRPPVFTSVPLVAAQVNTAYRYQARARDADGDALSFSLVRGPAGLAVDALSGEVSWVPDGDQVGIQDVILRVTDGHGGAATQSYAILLGQEPGNTPPVIISSPVLSIDVPDAPGAASGQVTPLQLDLDLGPGESGVRTVSLTLPSVDSGQGFADILFVVDETLTMAGDHDWLEGMIPQLDAELQARGIGPNRYILVGFGDFIQQDVTRPAHPHNLLETTALSMFGPTSSTVLGSQTLGPVLPLAAFEVTSATTGQQLVLVSETTDRPGNYHFHVLRPTVSNTPLALGTLVSGSIAVPSEKDSYTFTVTGPSQVYFDALTNDSRIKWSLNGPAGALVSNRPFTSSDSRFALGIPAISLVPGDYKLTVSADSSVIAPYQFRLSDVTTATPLTPGTRVTSSRAPANETDIYRFNAAAGDRFYFDLVSGSTSGDPLWRLVDPYGNVLFTREFRFSDFGDQDTLTLPQPGVYTLFIEGAITDTDANTYTFNVQPNPITTTPIVLGDVTSSTLAGAGELDRYTFTLNAPAQLYFDSLTNIGNINWTLTGPAGTAVLNRSLSGSESSSPPLNLVAGDYTLSIDANLDATGAYAFRASTLSAATPLIPGTPVSGDLNPANQTDLYSFTAAAGDRFSFDLQARSNGGLSRWRLVDPYGNNVFNTTFNSTTSSDVSTLTVSQPGSYTLLLEGAITDTGSGSYTFLVVPQGNVPLPPPPTSTPLVLGTTASDSISAAGEQDRYSFTLGSASLLYFDSLTNNGNLNWTLVGPAGTAVSARSFTASDVGTLAGSPALNLVAGSYILTVAGIGATTGSYSFRLTELSQAAPVTPGVPVSGVWNPGAETDLYKFSASAGDRFYFDVQASTFGGGLSANWQLIDPFGSVVFNKAFGGNSPVFEVDSPTLTQSGTYTLLIEGPFLASSTGSYAFNVQPVTVATAPLTLGSLASGSIAVAGEQDLYTFALASPSKLYFDSQTNNGNLTWTLVGPAGAAVTGRQLLTDAGLNSPVLNLPAGNYTLTIDGTGDQVGAYAFRLSDLASATPLTLGTPLNGDWNPGNETDLYRFQASPGDRFYFDAIASSFGGGLSATWQLIDPFGNSVFSKPLGGNSPVFEVDSPTLTQPGTYTLLIEGPIAVSTPGSYAFNVQPITITTNPLTVGNVVSGSISGAGEQDPYTFTLPLETQLVFDSLTNSSSLNWTLTGPTGPVVSGRAFNVSDGPSITTPVMDLPAGDYTLTVDGANDATGTYAFRLSDLTAAVALTPGTPVSGSLSPANETDLFRFDAAAGDRLYFDVQSRTGATSARWRLINPFGAVLFDTAFSSSSSDVDSLTLSTAGSYSVLLEGAVGETVAGTYTFVVRPASIAIQPLTMGNSISGAIGVGEQDRFTFTLAAASLLYFDSQTNNANLKWTLAGPAGTAVNARGFADAETNSPVLSLPAGDYSLTVHGGLDIAGTYAFRLADLSSATQFTPGTPVSGNLSPGNESDLYAFAAAAGDRFFFDVVARTGQGARWRLIDPFGSVIFNDSFDSAANLVDTLSIAQPGAYRLLVEGLIGATAPGTYAFNVQPVSIVTQPLTLGSVVNGAIDVTGDQDRYTFTLGATSLIYFDSLTNIGGINWTLSGPAGTAVASRSFGASDPTPILSLVAGEYTLTVDGAGKTTGAYSFLVSALSSATVLTPGTPVSGSLNPANETDLFRFSALANERYSFDVQDRTNGGGSRWRLVDPLGSIIFNSSFGSTSSDIGATTLALSGQYSLLLEGAISDTASGAYTFAVLPQGTAAPPAPPPSTPLVLGTTVSSSISAAGEQDRYTFTLSAATLLCFDSLTSDANLNWSLTGPTGTVVSNRTFTSSDAANGNPVLSLPAGDYTLTVAATGTSTGNYSFRLIELSAATAFVPGTPLNGSFDPANETDLYRFNALAGERFYFNTISRTNPGNDRWRLVDPFGNILFFNFFTGGDVDVLTLAQSGTYTLLLEAGASNSTIGGYTINVHPALVSTTPLTLGSVISSSLTTPGEQDRYTFTLSAASRLYFDSRTSSSNLNWTLAGPGGINVNRVFDSSDSVNAGGNPVISVPAGEYTLTIDGRDDTTSGYAFRLSDLSAAPSITPGTPFSGSLEPGNETDLYQFTASADQQFYFDSLARSGAPSGRWRLVDPYGNILFSNPYDAASVIEPDVLTLRAGVHTLLLEGHVANTVGGTYTINVQPVSFSSQAMAFGEVVQSTLGTAGEQDDYTFPGTTGQRVFFDGLVSSTNISARLFAPSGTLVFNTAANGNFGPFFLPESGTYRLNLDAPGDVFGQYGFVLHNLANAAHPAANGDIAGTLDQQLGSDLFLVDAAAGETLVFTPDTDLFVGTAQQVSVATRSLVAFGNIEDGYQAIDTGLRLDAFREGAAVNVVLLTDENRDVLDPSLTFDSTFSSLQGIGAMINGIHDAQFRDGGGRAALGVDSHGVAYVADGAGGFIAATGGVFVTGREETKEDYVDLEWALGGAAWDVGQLRVGGLPALSFTKAFVEIKTREIEQQLGLDLVASDPGVGFQNLTGTVNGVVAGETANFDVRITGDGNPHSFDLQFLRPGANVILGSIPVTINGIDYVYPVRAVDADGDPIHYSLVESPFGATIDAINGRVTWTPPAEGVYRFVIEADDGRGGRDTQAYDVTVTSGRPNQPPTITSTAPAQATEELPFAYSVTATDPDGDLLSYFLTEAPAGMGIDRTTGRVTWTPTVQQIGTHHIAVRVLDGRGGETTQTFILAVVADTGNRAPQIISTPITDAFSGDPYRYDVTATDADGDDLTFELVLKPSGMTIDQTTGEIAWQPAREHVGHQRVIVRVRDGRGGVHLQSYEVNVGAPGTAPVILEPPPSAPAVASLPYEHRFHALDADGDALVFQLTAAADGMTIDPDTGVLSWTPTLAQVRGHVVIVTVVDSQGLRDSMEFVLTVLASAPNVAPVFHSTPRTQAQLGGRYIYAVDITDANDDPITLTLTTAPAGMTIDPATRLVEWVPTSDQFGSNIVELRASDGRGGVALQSFVIEVAATVSNEPPRIVSTPVVTATRGVPYSYDLRGLDPDGDPLVWSFDAAPTGMSIDALLGTIRWTPANDQVGPADVTVRVTDAQGGRATQSFTINARAVNTPPTISSVPPTQGSVGRVYRYDMQATDPDGDPLFGASFLDCTEDPANQISWWRAEGNAIDDRGDNDGTLQNGATFATGKFGLAFQFDGSNDHLVVLDNSNLRPPQFTIEAWIKPSSTSGFDTVIAKGSSGLTPGYHGDANAYWLGLADGKPTMYTGHFSVLDHFIEGANALTPNQWHHLAGTFDGATKKLYADGVLVASATVASPLRYDNFDVPLTIGEDWRNGAASGLYPFHGLIDEPSIYKRPLTSGEIQAIFHADLPGKCSGEPPAGIRLAAFPVGMTIDGATGHIQWTPAPSQVGPQNITVEVVDGHGGTAQQSFTVVVAAASINRPPAIISSPIFLAAAGLPYSYDADAVDPEGDALTFELLTAPVGMSIDPNTGAIHWTPTNSQIGNQRVTLTVTDAVGNRAGQSYGLVVQPANRAPAINSAAVIATTAGLDYRYDVLANDPDNNSLNYSLATSPAGMSIDALGRITWATTIDDIGTHPVRVVVTDPFGASASQSFDLRINADTESPQVTVEVSESPATLGSRVIVFVSATDNVGVADLVLTVNGTPLPVDANGMAILNADRVGSVDVHVQATDAANNVGTATTTLVVIDPSDANAPDVSIISPSDGAVIARPVEVIGTASDDNLLLYTLEIAPLGSDTFTEFARGTSAVVNGVLGTLDPTMLQNDVYVLRLTATDAGGNVASVDQIVHVEGDLKLGNFTLSYTDLAVPVLGVPIAVSRTYDTLTARQTTDFGFGWRLEFRNMNLRTSVAPSRLEDYGIFNPFQVGSRVYLTLPGGNRQGFTFQPQVASGFRGGFLGIFEPRFVPDPGVKSSLTVTPADLRIRADGRVFDYGTGVPYNPTSRAFGGSYLLTTKEGIAFDIDGRTGQLTALSDSKNNVLSFSDGGIAGPEGISVTLERDPQGRITGIVDPAGNRVRYAYDARGDLVAVTDRTDNTTTFAYRTNPAHYLEKVIDPLGRIGVRNEYDDQGRLTGIVDAAGNPTQVSYDPHNLISRVTDALGNTTIEEYDARGNILSQIDALGAVTRRTFDADNNMLTYTDPLGRTTTLTYSDRGDPLTRTDPLGNVTISTFQAFTYGTTSLAVSRGQAAAPFTRPTTSIDPLGNKTTFDYEDDNGEILSTTDPAGHVTSLEYDHFGRPASAIIDALGNVTRVETVNGLVTREVDTLGHAMSYTYDANGNELTSTTTRTAADGTVQIVTTAAEYDAAGRVIKVIDAKGGVTRTEYDAAGRIVGTIDPLGRRTEYRYDERSLLVETVLPDETPADLTDNPRTKGEYDAIGRLIASIDELGRRTELQYDRVGRLTKTIFPDGTFTRTEYDRAGQVIAQVDARGNRTEFEYDATGRQTVVRDALGNVITTTYDAAGRMIATTDALSHTTRFVYDAVGRLVETDYADGTKESSEYDAMNRAVSKTDPAGRTRHAEYDALGRATAAIDALGQRTEYAYDEAGNLIRQRDANGHVTHYEYDVLNRLTASVLPLGQRSEATYDPAGNVTASTDFNGTTFTFVYDANNRIASKTFPDNTSVTYTYERNGLLSTITDARGTTSYVYDNRDRLQSHTEPDGTAVSYTYDANGNRTSVTAAVGGTSLTTSYTYDVLNRMATVIDPTLGVSRYSYNAIGNLTQTELPNGTVETRTYDDLNRLVFLEHRGSSGVITSQNYTLSATGHRISVLEQDGRRVDYTYDGLDRLTREAITDAVFGNQTFEYTYDSVGNRLSRNDSAAGLTEYTYDANDRLLTEALAGDVTRFTYDNNGNTLSRESATDHVLYEWDFENRLIAADTDGDGAEDVRNKYDDRGNRVSQTASGTETRFLVDRALPLPQVLIEYRPSGLITASFVFGNGIISQSRGGVQSFYHADGLGSIRALTDASGVVLNRYVYEAFGRLLRQTGNAQNPYQFAGQQRDSALGLDFMRARYYDANLGRFISPDPLRGSIAEPIYAYAKNDPVNRVDPSGLLSSLTEFAIFNAVLGALQGAIIGGITGGWEGALYGGLTGLVFGAAWGTGFHLLARGFGAAVYYAASSFMVLEGATNIKNLVTAENDQQRLVATVNLAFLGGGYLGTKVYYNRISGRGRYSAGGNTAEKAVGEWLADVLGAEIDGPGTLSNIQSGLTITKNGTTSSLSILDGRGRSFMDNVFTIRHSRGDKKFLILSEDQLRNNYVDFVESYANSGMRHQSVEVTVVTVSGTQIKVVRTFTAPAGVGPRPSGPGPGGSPGGVDPFGDTGAPAAPGAGTLPSGGPD